MAARSPLVALFATMLVLACSRVPEPAQVAALAAATPSLLSQVGSGDIPQSEWPVAVAQLNPKRVRATPEGLYVVLSSVSVEEHGLFVPRAAGFAGAAGMDPSYTAIGQGVFSYHVKG
ncbi:hypothetical protein GCM10027188_28990 [Lysobacter humi (ex Lee et al. 2017)]